jgi:hypothetical protein
MWREKCVRRAVVSGPDLKVRDGSKGGWEGGRRRREGREDMGDALRKTIERLEEETRKGKEWLSCWLRLVRIRAGEKGAG